MKESTFIMLKPDTLERGLFNEVLGYLEEEDSDDEPLKVCAMTSMTADPDLVEEHYANVTDPEVKRELHEYFDNEAIVAAVVYGENAVERVRQLIGGEDFYPEGNTEDTIRGDIVYNEESEVYADPEEWPQYRKDTIATAEVPLYNMIHAAENPEDAKEEIVRFFGSELYEAL